MDPRTAEREKSITDMSEEELAASLGEDDEEPDPPPPSAYALWCNGGRCGFLESYIWRGEVALFEAVAHIWSSLAEPKNLRCIAIGMWAGTGGSGKYALAKFLRRALRESLDYEGTPPWGQQFDTLDEFHAAATTHFEDHYANYQRTIQKYADILNGEPGRHAPIRSMIIQGPWRALPDQRQDGGHTAADTLMGEPWCRWTRVEQQFDAWLLNAPA